MKHQTQDSTSQISTQEKNSKEVLSIKHFYDIFNEKRSPKKPRVSFRDFKNIVFSYLKTYFYELYLNNKPMYFFFGGNMKLVAYLPWSDMQKRSNTNKPVLHRIGRSIGLFWYNRPSERLYYMVKIKKLTGSTNILPKIEAMFNNNNDKDLLPIFTEEQKKGKIDKTLYRCIQT